jgi:hypothetical protein
MKRQLRRFIKRLCVGLRAVAHTDDLIKGRRDKFTRTAIIVAVPLTMAAAGGEVKAQAAMGNEADEAIRSGAKGVYNFVRDGLSSMSSADKTRLLLDAMQGKPGGQVLVEHLGSEAGKGPADAGQVYAGPSSTYSTATGALNGGNPWKGTVCDY